MEDGVEVEEGVQLVDNGCDGRGAQRPEDCVCEFWPWVLAVHVCGFWREHGAASPLRSLSLSAMTQPGKAEASMSMPTPMAMALPPSSGCRSVRMTVSLPFWLRMSSE